MITTGLFTIINTTNDERIITLIQKRRILDFQKSGQLLYHSLLLIASVTPFYCFENMSDTENIRVILKSSGIPKVRVFVFVLSC